MIQTRQIGQHTEIYVPNQNGGGKSATYITQNKTTVFHDFWTRKFLLPEESAGDYREVTEAECTKLQAVRDAWVRPPQVFIDKWNTACGIWGRYNEETGYFELNGITDITYEEAQKILLMGLRPLALCAYNGARDGNVRIRTNIPPVCDSGGKTELTSVFYRQYDMEVAVIWAIDNAYSWEENIEMTSMNYSFSECYKLKRIIGGIKITASTKMADSFRRCDNLEDIELYISDRSNVDLSPCPKLSHKSIKFIIDNKHGAACSIKVHADVYAKMTGDTTNAAAAALSADELAQWMALVETAAEKNITFTT